MEYSALTKEEKQDIFEIVNSTHLRLKGNQKKILKSTFCNVWKINKNVGAFELFMKLYESNDEYDKMNEWFKQYLAEDPFDAHYYRTHKQIPYAKHRRFMGYRGEEIEELEKKLEDVESGKGYIKKDIHDDEILELKKEWRNKVYSLEDEVSRLKNKLIHVEQDANARVQVARQQAEYFKKQLNLLSIKKDD
jgi:hypothetical protein